MRRLIITGNGLGMALDPERFSLANAIKAVWGTDDSNPEWDSEGKYRSIIVKCLGSEGAPTGEDQLDNLHQIVTACELLQTLYLSDDQDREQSDKQDRELLTDRGKELPYAIKNFVYSVARHLYVESVYNVNSGQISQCVERANHKRFREFLGVYDEFVTKDSNQVDVATLNYDGLLYAPFLGSPYRKTDRNQKKMFANFDGALVDGFLSDGFGLRNLQEGNEKGLGSYMHLHGTPLFYDGRDGAIHKESAFGRNESLLPSHHLVLTHVKHKKAVIERSSILKEYWEHLDICISDAQEIILFGYSGLDAHLNERIEPHCNAGKPLRIVEWLGACGGEDKDAWATDECNAQRVEYWKNKFPHFKGKNLVRMENILDFRDWGNEVEPVLTQAVST